MPYSYSPRSFWPAYINRLASWANKKTIQAVVITQTLTQDLFLNLRVCSSERPGQTDTACTCIHGQWSRNTDPSDHNTPCLVPSPDPQPSSRLCMTKCAQNHCNSLQTNVFLCSVQTIYLASSMRREVDLQFQSSSGTKCDKGCRVAHTFILIIHVIYYWFIQTNNRRISPSYQTVCALQVSVSSIL